MRPLKRDFHPFEMSGIALRRMVRRQVTKYPTVIGRNCRAVHKQFVRRVSLAEKTQKRALIRVLMQHLFVQAGSRRQCRARQCFLTK